MSDSKFDAAEAFALTTKCAPEKYDMTEPEANELRQVLEHIARSASHGYMSTIVTIHSDNVVNELRARGFDAAYNTISGRHIVAWAKGHAAD